MLVGVALSNAVDSSFAHTPTTVEEKQIKEKAGTGEEKPDRMSQKSKKQNKAKQAIILIMSSSLAY